MFPDEIGPNDNTRRRTFTLDKDIQVHATCTDPYGLWHLSLNRGALPDEFRGSYTSFDEVKLAVERYQTKRHLALKDIELKTKGK